MSVDDLSILTHSAECKPVKFGGFTPIRLSLRLFQQNLLAVDDDNLMRVGHPSIGLIGIGHRIEIQRPAFHNNGLTILAVTSSKSTIPVLI